MHDASYGRLPVLYTAISCKFLTFPPDFLITPARASPSASFSDSKYSTVSAVRVIYGSHVVKTPDFYDGGREGTSFKYLQSLYVTLTNSFPTPRRFLLCLATSD